MERLKDVGAVGLIAVLMLCFAGCGNDAPVSPDDNGGGPQGFAITAVTPDTLYLGEEAWLTVNEPIDSSEVKLFLHTTEVNEWRVAKDTIFFTIPSGARASRPRLYRDTELVVAPREIFIISKHISELMPRIVGVSGWLGRPGDALVLHGYEIPVRQKDISVSISGMLHPIEYRDEMYLIVRVEEGVGTGQIVVHAYGEEIYRSEFVRIEEGEPLLPKNFFYLTMQGAITPVELSHRVYNSSDFNTTLDFLSVSKISAGFNESPIRQGDSLIVKSHWEDFSNRTSIEMRLRTDPHVNLASGTIKYIISYPNIPNARSEFVLEIRDMPWYRINNSYTLYANGPDVAKRLTIKKWVDSNNSSIDSLISASPDHRSYFSLTLYE
jgi:hypothetical protein